MEDENPPAAASGGNVPERGGLMLSLCWVGGEVVRGAVAFPLGSA